MGLIGNLLSLLFSGPKQYGTLSVTVRGEEVKSHGEQLIADYLASNGIRYKYEHPIDVGIWIFTSQLSRPDFYLPDYDVYVEYWGMVDIADERKRQEYVRSMRWKMAKYHAYGVKCVSIYPRNLNNLDWIFRKKFREISGVELPKRGRSSVVDTERGGPARTPKAPRKVCPECKGELVLRTAGKGFNRGGQFWGCSNYPRCKYILRNS